MTTIYAKVVESGPPEFGKPVDMPGDWHEWRNVKPSDMATMSQMILMKWLRERGGLQWGETLSVTVYTFDGCVERQPNSEPVACLGSSFNVSRDREGVTP